MTAFFLLLSFLAGAGLTWLWTVRAVTREVPILEAAPVAAGVGAGVGAGAGAAAASGASRGSLRGGSPSGFIDTQAGDGSVWADADGNGPAGWAVKADDEALLYSVEGSAEFDRMYAQLWFKDEEAAKRAGYSRWIES